MKHAKDPNALFPVRTFISELPTSLIAQPTSQKEGHEPARRRLIIIGDIHGMRQSLEALLKKVDFDKSKGDHLILVGDLLNKGPDSPGVVDLAIKLGASAVRGNHENAVLDAWRELQDENTRQHALEKIRAKELETSEESSKEQPSSHGDGENVTSKSEPPPENLLRHGVKSYQTVMHLSNAQLEWLANLPIILRLSIPSHFSSSLGDTLLIVHAGFLPGLPLEKQDPYAIMHLRSFSRSPEDGNVLVPDEEFGDEGWAEEWDRWQDGQESRTTVVFGHDAKRRLQLNRHSIGLDSGCLYGNELSALVVEATGDRIEHRIEQVDCADVPIAPKVTKE